MILTNIGTELRRKVGRVAQTERGDLQIKDIKRFLPFFIGEFIVTFWS